MRIRASPTNSVLFRPENLSFTIVFWIIWKIFSMVHIFLLLSPYVLLCAPFSPTSLFLSHLQLLATSHHHDSVLWYIVFPSSLLISIQYLKLISKYLLLVIYMDTQSLRLHFVKFLSSVCILNPAFISIITFNVIYRNF